MRKLFHLELFSPRSRLYSRAHLALTSPPDTEIHQLGSDVTAVFPRDFLCKLIELRRKILHNIQAYLYSICVAENILIFLNISVSATQRNRLNINIRLEIALHRELPEKYTLQQSVRKVAYRLQSSISLLYRQ